MCIRDSYRSWLHGFDGGKSLKPVSCFGSNRYEPYVVLRKSPLLPMYEERFTGYGKNKIEQIVHLRYAGWRFQVLGRSFLTHFPHHKSAARVSGRRPRTRTATRTATAWIIYIASSSRSSCTPTARPVPKMRRTRGTRRYVILNI